MDAEPAPRIVIISGDQLARAGLRAELRERGYDAVGARDVPGSFRYSRPAPGRGPVRLVIVDHDALGDDLAAGLLERLRRRFGNPPLVLLAHATREQPEGDWTTVLRRPISVGEIADYVDRLLPNPRARGPLDERRGLVSGGGGAFVIPSARQETRMRHSWRDCPLTFEWVPRR